MTLGIASLLVTALSIQSFMYFIQLDSLDNVIKNVDVGLIKNNLIISSDEDTLPQINKTLFEEDTINYFKDNLSGRIKIFKVTFYYYDENKIQIYNENPVETQIKLNAKLMFNIDYTNSINLKIGEVFIHE